ncbi:MAG: hypothetical protein KDJ25_03390 [Rhodoblastus sp.]|nr:hypothetical protein [Rhodoblastus sp.]
MDFFLTQILARLVGGYLAYDCARSVWCGLRNGKIRLFQSGYVVWWPVQEVERDAAPLLFWIQIAIQTFLFFPCLVFAIVGWV